MASSAKKITKIDPDSDQAGTVEYRMNTENAPKGVFSTAYYFRDLEPSSTLTGKGQPFRGQNATWAKTDVYKSGLIHYLKVTEAPEFSGWKLVIYTDALSLENPLFKSTNSERYAKHKKEWEIIANHPNTIFAVINFPEYSVGGDGDGKTVDNAIIRAFRMKAFYDFPEIPVFVRDADTLFENLIKVKTIYQELVAWELTLWEQLKKIVAIQPYQMIIASQPNYQRQWHVHPGNNIKTIGCYAALTSSLGGIKEWSNGSLWKACLSYLRKYSKVVSLGNERKPTNISQPTYIGKDEQLLSYVVLPMIFPKVYFYYFEYIQVEGNKIVADPNLPFAQILLDQGLARYPSAYIESLGEQYLPLEDSVGKKRKDANEVTETTILNPALIPMSLDIKLHTILQTIYKYYMGQFAASSKQAGGRRKRTRKRLQKRSRKRGRG